MIVTEDRFLARVVAAWSISSESAQPLFIAVSGLVAATAGVRLTLGGSVLLPWRTPVRGRPVSVGSVDERVDVRSK
jgi:hypothetical protein